MGQLFKMDVAVQEKGEAQGGQIGKDRNKERVFQGDPKRVLKIRIGEGLLIILKPDQMHIRVIAIGVGKGEPEAFQKRKNKKGYEKEHRRKDECEISKAAPAFCTLHDQRSFKKAGAWRTPCIASPRPGPYQLLIHRVRTGWPLLRCPRRKLFRISGREALSSR